MRPCGLSPCAPRYYYSTPRCTLVYSLVLSSVRCASVVCPVPCLPCLWCGCVVLWLWCVGAVRPAPALPAPVGVCYGVPCTPCTFPVFFLGIIPALYIRGAICGPCTLPIYVPYFLGLLFMIRSVHAVKAGPWIPNVDFQKSA